MARSPTVYSELNAILTDLVEGAKSALKDNLIGVYLQGSFAVGDHSAYSDCDFIIVVGRDLVFGELQALHRLHKEIHSLPYPYWRRGLEGSYAPAAILLVFIAGCFTHSRPGR